MANGGMVHSIIVENDGEYEAVEGLGQTVIRQLSPNRRSATS